MFSFLERHKKGLVYLPLALYWLLLLFLTSLPSQKLPKTGVNDKIEHFSAYFILGLLLSLALLIQNKFSKLKKIFSASALIIIALYAALDEIHQLFIPGRDCDILDWSSDVIGTSIGILLIIFLRKVLQNRETKFY